VPLPSTVLNTCVKKKCKEKKRKKAAFTVFIDLFNNVSSCKALLFLIAQKNIQVVIKSSCYKMEVKVFIQV